VALVNNRVVVSDIPKINKVLLRLGHSDIRMNASFHCAVRRDSENYRFGWGLRFHCPVMSLNWTDHV